MTTAEVLATDDRVGEFLPMETGILLDQPLSLAVNEAAPVVDGCDAGGGECAHAGQGLCKSGCIMRVQSEMATPYMVPEVESSLHNQSEPAGRVAVPVGALCCANR